MPSLTAGKTPIFRSWKHWTWKRGGVHRAITGNVMTLRTRTTGATRSILSTGAGISIHTSFSCSARMTCGTTRTAVMAMAFEFLGLTGVTDIDTTTRHNEARQFRSSAVASLVYDRGNPAKRVARKTVAGERPGHGSSPGSGQCSIGSTPYRWRGKRYRWMPHSVYRRSFVKTSNNWISSLASGFSMLSPQRQENKDQRPVGWIWS